MIQDRPNQQIDFTVDENNLYREESVTDLQVASIRRLMPIKADGSDDPARTAIYIGHTQIMSEHGPLPIQAELEADSLQAALKAFPPAMEKALMEMVEKIQQLQRQQELAQMDASRIIVPGR